MKTLYITTSGQVVLGDNNSIDSMFRTVQRIDDIFLLKEDTKVIYKKGETNVEMEGKAGDIVITFYEGDFPNKVIIVNSNEWAENITAYENAEQKRKEEWAAKNAADIPTCDKTCCDPCPC